MTTLKQLEALAAIASTGSVDGAARHLGVVHSAISRQIKDLEDGFGFPLLNRTNRSAQLTVDGLEVLNRAKAVLRERDLLLERIASKEVLTRKLRIGVTELTALTWLPNLLTAIQAEYPQVIIEPEVDLTAHLRRRVRAGQLDIAILPYSFTETGYVKEPLADIRCEWYCAPALYTPGSFPVTRLSEYTLLVQDGKSGIGVIIPEWLKRHNAIPKKIISSNSIVALIGIAASGFGLAPLPQPAVRSMMVARQLAVLDMTPKLPHLTYGTLIRSDSATPFLRHIMELAKLTCNYDSPYPSEGLLPSTQEQA
jgi:DNA-binding transcriptional LysR family regulator